MSPTYSINTTSPSRPSSYFKIPQIVLQIHTHTLDYHPHFGFVTLTDFVPLKKGIKSKNDILKALKIQGRVCDKIVKTSTFTHTGSFDCLHFDSNSKKMFSVVHRTIDEKMISFSDSSGNQGIVVRKTGSLVNTWVDFYP
ncbi:hypothetical protein [Nitrosopumilus sp. b2]|uniref:hypothetical protein n=1 Tax=Nitrosopumilus sp. b2 TaxID=2109908 RepID=UPI0015F4D34D|nr:hypothetical protein [Nitrosopumilus sp. b2]KAF6244336.1 hypothetical protein C6989_08625 [Nitrosopumilus sp. b2]